jgi:hypothetical protein
MGHVELKILDTLTFTKSAVRNAESVSFSSLSTYFVVKQKFIYCHRSIKFYNVDKQGKGLTVLVGSELVDVH